MKAAVLYGYNQPFKIEDVPKPVPKGYEVLIKVAGAGVCHSDLHLWRGELKDIAPPTFPLILGHEVSGVVEEVGEYVPPHIKPGSKVIVYWAYCEQDDKYALKGLYQLCSLRAPAGIAYYNGGFAEYMLVPHYRYLISAEGLEDLVAASVLSCAGATAMRSVKKIINEVDEDEYVVIIGLGGLGILALQLVRILTGARIIGIDVKKEKIERAWEIVKLSDYDVLIDASQVDVRRSIYEATGGRTVKAVLDFVGSEKTIETYIDLLSPMGTYVIVGLGSDQSLIPIRKMVVNEISIKTVFYSSYRELETLIDLARRKMINYKDIVEKIKLEDINNAIERLARGEVMYRQVIEF